jgi:hypothetical protein
MTGPAHVLQPTVWADLVAADPDEVCGRTGATFDNVSAAYEVEFLNERHRIHPPTCMFELIRGPDLKRDLSVEFKLALITYLLHAQQLDLTGKLVAPTSLRGGISFFQGAHRLPLQPLMDYYGRDPEAFVGRGLSLGGEQARFGDASVRFPALPRLPVTMVLWASDEEVPARLSVLFDSSADKILSLHGIYDVVSEICKLMVESGR